MSEHSLNIEAQRKTLEDLFFLKQDQILMEQFHRIEKMKKTKETLAAVSGIKNEDVLQAFLDIGISPDVVASLALVPLVEVAWADGEMEEKEKAAILKADGQFFAKDSPDMTILKQWMQHKPRPELMDAWKQYIKGLCEQMAPAQKASLKAEVVGHARVVAEAAGGFLGFGNKVSDAEQKVLNQLDMAFE